MTSTCTLLSNVPNKVDHESLRTLLAKLDGCRVCPGHPDTHFVEMVMAKKGTLTSSDGKEIVAALDSNAPVELNGEVYTQTVRHRSCEILTNGTKCPQCVKYRDSLRKVFHRWQKRCNSSPGHNTASTSHTNVRYLNTPERQERYRKLKVRSDTAERRVKRMLEKLTEKDGVQLDDGMHDDLQSIMIDMTSEVRDQNSEGSFRRIFWEQQLEAMSKKNRRHIRWHPALIKWCLHLKFKSTSAYHALRSTGVLTLPSERTLFDYSHWIKGEVGFQAAVNAQLIEEADIKEEKDRYVVLSFDEMKIREDLVFDKHSCSLVGFTNLGDVSNVLESCERQCDSEAPDKIDKVATHMLAFMVRGIFSKLEFPYAHFPTKGATGEELFPIVWDGVRNLEESGFRVMVLTCDGASPNRKFFKMHTTGGRQNGHVTYKTRNPYSPDDRDIFFMSDVPHLMKTTRNCWSNSFGHSHTRALWVCSMQYRCYIAMHKLFICVLMQKDGNYISWSHITALYDKSRFSSGLSMIPKLKKEHIHLNSYSRMRVNLAAQVSKINVYCGGG